MACFHPLEAWQTVADRRIHFTEKPDSRFLHLPCGRCIGCRLTKARSWAIRLMHEAQMHQANAFITLTYRDEDCPVGLQYSDFQKFMRRLRKAKGEVRFFACGEYGDENFRPHWHALIFGTTFTRDYPVKKDVWGSKELDNLWGHGHAGHGDVTFQSAGYCARYAVKKINGEKAERWYTRLDTRTGELAQVQPELARMSLKPGIGKTWFEKYWREVYEARDGVVQQGGNTIPPPRQYDRWLEATAPDLKEAKDYERYIRSEQFAKDTTPDRLAVREKCAAAKAAFLKRHL